MQATSLNHIAFYFAYLGEEAPYPTDSESWVGFIYAPGLTKSFNVLVESTYEDNPLKSRQLDSDSDMGVRLYIERNVDRQWSPTSRRQFGMENFTFFSSEGQKITTPWLLHLDDNQYSLDVEKSMKSPTYDLGDSRASLYF